MKRQGFTLIELLIVVAIIAILAAIAVPNFLEARTRSLVSRSQSDMRTLALGVESYVVDHAELPPDAATRPYIPLANAFYQIRRADQDAKGGLQVGMFLTTPIGYIADISWDPFGNKGIERGIGETKKAVAHAYGAKVYSYNPAKPDQVLSRPWNRWVASGVESPFHEMISPQPWFMWGIGPTYNYGKAADLLEPETYGAPAWVVPYDPTNGTVSDGGIWRFASGSLF